MMDERENFKRDGRLVLNDYVLSDLRCYARYLRVHAPTDGKNKAELVEEILAVLTKEKEPAQPNKRGKPVKAKGVKEEIVTRMDELCRQHKLALYSAVQVGENGVILPEGFDTLPEHYKDFFDSAIEMHANKTATAELYVGQFQKIDGVCWILPLNCVDKGENILISETLADCYKLMEGDVVKCYAVKSAKALVVKEVTEINGLGLSDVKRVRFDEEEIATATERIVFSDGVRYASETLKFIEWLVPICKGQRGCLISSPKVGKTKILLQVADAVGNLNEKIEVVALLVDQTPETVAEYRQAVKAGNLLATTYDDDPDRQIFVAEYLLKRVKRYAECGKDVLLIVDSLNALAHAYNDTDASTGGKTLACGLETKTLHYLKKFFGTARAFKSGGSITVLGAVTVNSGNPADEVIASELSAISNVEIRLDDESARRRVFPALTVSGVSVKQSDSLRTPDENKLDLFLRSQSGTLTQEHILRALTWSKSAEETLGRLQ